MKLGCFFQAPEAPGHSHADRYAEMIELIGLAHRVVVMRNGRVMATLAAGQLSEEELISHATGTYH